MQPDKQLALDCGMPKRFLNVKSSDFDEGKVNIAKKTIELFMQLKPETCFCLIHGKTGIGKSRLAALIFLSIIYKSENKESWRFSWRSLVELNQRMKSTYSRSGALREDIDESQIYTQYCYMPELLVLEFGDIESEGNIYGGDNPAERH